MKAPHRLAPLVVLGGVAAVAAACGPAQAPRYTMKMPEQRAHLANGMNVILLADTTTDLVEVDVRYKVGSKEDPPGRAGLAHLVEHLMFQQHQAGPDKPSLGAVLRQHALYFNAFTNWDSTHYQTLASADELDALLAIEGTRLATGCESITQETFEREREVVRNEIRQRTGTADDLVMVKILEDVYPDGHPYRRIVGGDDAQLAAITLEDACKFMRDYYVPERATVVIAGKAEVAALGASVDKWLAPLEARPGARLVDVPPLRGGVRGKASLVHEMDTEENSVIVAWPLPSLHGEDADAVRFIIGSVFGRAAAFGSMYEFASGVEPVVLGGADAPILAIFVGLRGAGDAGEARAAVLRAAASAHRGLENGEFFEETKARLLGQLAMTFEPLSTRAVRYGDYAQFEQDGKAFGGEIERIRKLDADHLKSVVKRVLAEGNATVITIKARKSAGGGYARAAARLTASGEATRDELPVDRSEAAASLSVPAHATVLAGARRFDLGNGMHVVLLHTDSPLPVVSARLIFAVGEAHDPPSMVGLAETVADQIRGPLGVEGTGGNPFSFDGFGRIGIPWRAHADIDTTTIEARGLAIHQDMLVKGLASMVKYASFTQDAIEERQRLFELALRRRGVQSQRAVDKLLGEAVYGADHPYARTAVATAATRKKIGLDEARDYVARHWSAKNATLILAGAFDEKQAERDIRASFGDWSGGSADAPVSAPAQPRSGPVALAVLGAESPQIRAHLAYPTPAGIDPAFAARLVLVEILRRRVADIRERLGASYGVHVRYEPRVGPGLIEIAGAIDADRGAESLLALRAILDGLLRGEGFVEDFVRARRRVMETVLVNANDSGTLTARLAQIAIFHLPPTFADDLVNQVARLTPRDVLALAGKELAAGNEVAVIEGTRTAVEKTLAGAKIEGKIVETASK